MTKQPRIKKAEPRKEFYVFISWSTGDEHIVHLFGFMRDFEVFRPIFTSNYDKFMEMIVGDHGLSLHWTDDAEISANTVWRLALDQDAERLKGWRNRHHMSQEKAADALGLSTRMLKYYEAASHPIPKTVRLACAGYDALENAAE